MVIYISTFKSEVGNKLRPKSSFQGPMFRYHYGYSFILAVCGLMMCELAGTFTIFLFIHWHKVDIMKKRQHQHRHHMHHHHQHHLKDVSEDHVPCRRHGRGQPRRGSHKLDTSPPRGGRGRQHSLQQSESMRDLDYYNFPVVSRDTTCNTVSTSADITRDITREFSFEILRRTTPVWEWAFLKYNKQMPGLDTYNNIIVNYYTEMICFAKGGSYYVKTLVFMRGELFFSPMSTELPKRLFYTSLNMKLLKI